MRKGLYSILGQVIGELVLCSPIILVSYYYGLVFECLLAILCLFAYKPLYPNSIHFRKNIHCIMISYLAIILNLLVLKIYNKEYFLVIILCNSIALGPCELANLVYKAKEADYLRSRLFSTGVKPVRKFNTDTCSKEELISRCRELKFNPQKTELCIKLFIDNISYSELADSYFMEPSSMAVKKLRLKKKLNNV